MKYSILKSIFIILLIQSIKATAYLEESAVSDKFNPFVSISTDFFAVNDYEKSLVPVLWVPAVQVLAVRASEKSGEGSDQVRKSEIKEDIGFCEIPSSVDILHVPTKSWTADDDFTIAQQEIVSTVKEKGQRALDFVNQGIDFLMDRDNSSKEEKDNSNRDHALPAVLEIVEERAYAQFQLVKIIKENPQALVFHEWTTHIADSRMLNTFRYAMEVERGVQRPEQLTDNRTMEDLFQLVNSQFPNTFPTKYHSLSPEQKETLAIVGGVWTLFFLFELPVIFPAFPYSDYGEMLINLGLSAEEMAECKVLNVAYICDPVLQSMKKEGESVRFKKALAVRRAIKDFIEKAPLSALNGPAVIMDYGSRPKDDLYRVRFEENTNHSKGLVDVPAVMKGIPKNPTDLIHAEWFSDSTYNYYHLSQSCLSLNKQ